MKNSSIGYVIIGSVLIIIATYGFLLHVPILDGNIDKLKTSDSAIEFNLWRSEARINIARTYEASLRILLELDASKSIIDKTTEDVKVYYIDSISSMYFTLNQRNLPNEMELALREKGTNELVQINNNYIEQVISLKNVIIDEIKAAQNQRNIFYYLYGVANILGLLLVLLGNIKEKASSNNSSIESRSMKDKSVVWKQILEELYRHAPNSYGESLSMGFKDDNHPLAKKLKISGQQLMLGVSFLSEHKLIERVLQGKKKDYSALLKLTPEGFKVALQNETNKENVAFQHIVAVATTLGALVAFVSFLFLYFTQGVASGILRLNYVNDLSLAVISFIVILLIAAFLAKLMLSWRSRFWKPV